MPGRTWTPSKTGPRPSDKLTPYEDIADPANGNRVPRCRTCGYPKRPGIAVLDFGLTLHGKAAGHYRLCERCYREAQGSLTVDPLTLMEAGGI